jgi:membrane protein
MAQSGTDRGRTATAPQHIPGPGWKDVGLRAKEEVKNDSVPLLAAGAAFYSMLALFPALIALVMLYGLVASPADVQTQVEQFAGALPQGAASLISQQMESLAGAQQSSLSIGLVSSLALALWSASSGLAGLIKGINIAYDEAETRGFVKVRGLALLLTIGAIVFIVVALGLVAVLPVALDLVGLGGAAQIAISVLRWPLLAVFVVLGLAVLYRLAPDRDDPQLRWVSPGAVIATVLWLVGSALFSLYVNNFGSYGETYGAQLAGVIVLLLWLFLTSFVVLLGAEINAEIERQTGRDTTTGPEKPMGDRRAQAADTLGETRA